MTRLDRHDAPLYLARYQDRKVRRPGEVDGSDPGGTPLYLTRFRERRPANGTAPAGPPLPESYRDGNQRTAVMTKSKEIVALPEGRIPLVATISLVRHAETQGYASESGLTPLGSWQARRRGFDISKGVRNGDTVRLVCAPTNRAGQTASQLYGGILDGLAQWGREADVEPPEPRPEFDNFQVATPNGGGDATAAWREYRSVMESHERTSAGQRPLWLVELDRFWRTQQGGADPIHYWLTIPMMYVEPPAVCVRRFLGGIRRLVTDYPGARILCATHSGPMRALAIWAFGYDPGEPYNVEEIRIQVSQGAEHAQVAYRNRVQDVALPAVGALPDWGRP